MIVKKKKKNIQLGKCNKIKRIGFPFHFDLVPLSLHTSTFILFLLQTLNSVCITSIFLFFSHSYFPFCYSLSFLFFFTLSLIRFEIKLNHSQAHPRNGILWKPVVVPNVLYLYSSILSIEENDLFMGLNLNLTVFYMWILNLSFFTHFPSISDRIYMYIVPFFPSYLCLCPVNGTCCHILNLIEMYKYT